MPSSANYPNRQPGHLEHISLDLADFRTLVRGGVVTKGEFSKITLRDIGWAMMLDEIHQATVDASKRATDGR
jgi:hypothetical protein